MQSQSVRAFKNELRNYNYYLSRLVSLDNSIEWVYDRLGGVRGVDPSKEPTHNGVPNKDLEYKLRDDIERYEQEKTLVRAKVDYIDKILSRMKTELKCAVMSVYVEGKSFVLVSRKMYLSPNGLQKRINKAIEKALDE